MQSLVQFRFDFLHLQRKVLHPVLHLQAIINWQDSGTGDNDISIGFTFIPSTFQPIGSGLGMTGKAK